MRRIVSFKKTKSIKKVHNYETTPEDKSRRKAIPKGDFGQATTDYLGDRRSGHILADALRQSSMVYKLVLRKMKGNSMLIAVIGLLTGVWLSGFYAHANMRFESLLSAVLGVVVLFAVGLWSTKK